MGLKTVDARGTMGQKRFEDWALVEQGTLSTMAVPDKFVDWMRSRCPKARI